uniref:Protein of centriole 5 n=1 Tax=Parastrongyloides trichosuri TaxID=131310 RepID=A0A0N4ZLD1_PARTI
MSFSKINDNNEETIKTLLSENIEQKHKIGIMEKNVSFLQKVLMSSERREVKRSITEKKLYKQSLLIADLKKKKAIMEKFYYENLESLENENNSLKKYNDLLKKNNKQLAEDVIFEKQISEIMDEGTAELELKSAKNVINNIKSENKDLKIILEKLVTKLSKNNCSKNMVIDLLKDKHLCLVELQTHFEEYREENKTLKKKVEELECENSLLLLNNSFSISNNCKKKYFNDLMLLTLKKCINADITFYTKILKKK